MIRNFIFKKKILVRVDCGYKIGMGHLLRCLELARTLKSKGVSILFVCRGNNAKTFKFVKQAGFPFFSLPPGISWAEDAKRVCVLANRLGVGMILTDLNHAEFLKQNKGCLAYMKILKKSKCRIVIFDGLYDNCLSRRFRVPADMVIIPYLKAEKKKYKLNSETNRLLGAKYFIFRKEFLSNQSRVYKINSKVNRMLITMGGSDPSNLTADAIDAVLRLNNPKIRLSVIIGPEFMPVAKRKILKQLKENYQGFYRVIENPKQLTRWLCWADIAIIGNGLTKYEAALMGTPSVVLSQNQAVAQYAAEFQRAGALIHCQMNGKTSRNRLSIILSKLMEDFEMRKRLSRNGRDLTDGEGVLRIAEALVQK